jgi:hypothetical protein
MISATALWELLTRQAGSSTPLGEGSGIEVAPDCGSQPLRGAGLIDNLGGARQKEALFQVFGE